MQVHVKILGALNKPQGKDEFDVELSPGAVLEEVLVKSGYHPTHFRFILPAVNGTMQPLGFAMTDQDQVLLALPTSGG